MRFRLEETVLWNILPKPIIGKVIGVRYDSANAVTYYLLSFRTYPSTEIMESELLPVPKCFSPARRDVLTRRLTDVYRAEMVGNTEKERTITIKEDAFWDFLTELSLEGGRLFAIGEYGE